ncbi:putative chromo domain-containing protein LHP1 isoform X2 [Carex rostrata]
MVLIGGRKKAEAASSSRISDEVAAGEHSPSDRDHQLDEEVKGQEESPLQADEEDEGEEGGEEEEEEEEEEVDADGGEGGSDEEGEEENGVEVAANGGKVVEEAGGKQKLDEGFYEIEAIRKKRYRKGQLQYLIKWRDYPETANTWEPYDNIKYCADMLEAFEQSSRKRKRKRRSTLPKKKRPVQSEDGGEGTTTQTREGDNSPLFPSSSSGRGRGRGRGRARITERDILVPKRNPRRSINSHDKKENNLLKDKKEKEKPTKDDAMTNGVLVSLPEGVGAMNKEGGTNFVMADNVQKERENEKTEASGDGASMAIDLPSCKINIEGHGEAPLALLPVGPVPSVYSSSQPQGSKASSQITGAKKRKSGSVRRFVQPEEEVKKAMDIEVVDSTEMACASVVNTAIDNNSIKVKDEVHITKILKPTELSASSSPATDNIQHVFITFKALRSDGTEVLVNNKELRATNPLLLIDFYEQHLRYTPDP